MFQKLDERVSNEKPVFIFTGFLGSGKTEFIQDTLSNPEFGNDGKTLLVVCEEGELEYDETAFAGPGVTVKYIREEEDLVNGELLKISSGCMYDRVIVEYNGMWMLESLFNHAPRNWTIVQEMCFFDATTFQIYNANMRQQCFDKMKTADMIVFNRCEHSFDKMAFHKEVRIANRKVLIVYEYGPDDVEPDDIEDPLPYDMSQKKLLIKDEWYAEWYRDLNENEEAYDGKIVSVKGRVAINKELPDGRFAFGRHVMTCCEADIAFAAFMAIYSDTSDLEVGDWVEVTAKIRVEYEEAYQGKGPVLHVTSLAKTEPCDPEVATF